MPAASVVVATRNRAHLLRRLVRALESQTGVQLEVVIVDDASTDETPAVSAELAATSPLPVTVVRQPLRRGQSAGRNVGWRAATTDLVLFTDDDCVPRPEWARRMCDALSEHDLVQGRTIPAPDQLHHAGPFSRTLDISEANGWYATCNMSYRRSWLELVGGFDESFRHHAGEDTDLAMRCLDRGATFRFDPGAVVAHDIRPSSFQAALRGTWRWLTIPETVARHEALRSTTHGRWVWRESHEPTATALVAGVAGVALAASGRPRAAALVAGAGGVRYASYRLRRAPLTLDKRARLVLLPAAFAVDAAEVGVLLLGSLRARRLLV